ncbi:hypothetical protein C8Z91_34780 [Paenibacillus elgii]|uniref:Uncharacterized protein n=1 Tax=Paenibacillus elgii TaxID=189691 RepID=A0A2T6FRU7_9BACL|nr:hypothetical protein C8Z91_34780 [Paenibacillus elgii]
MNHLCSLVLLDTAGKNLEVNEEALIGRILADGNDSVEQRAKSAVSIFSRIDWRLKDLYNGGMTLKRSRHFR